MKRLSSIFLFFLALSLTVGEAGASYNQARMAGARSVTICSSYGGTQELRIGANGRPLPASGQHNHSCCLFVGNATPPVFVTLLPRMLHLQDVVVPEGRIATVTHHYYARARSPPVVV